MKGDLQHLLTCDTLILLPHWADSNGATLEHLLATRLHYDLITVWPSIGDGSNMALVDGSLGWSILSDSASDNTPETR